MSNCAQSQPPDGPPLAVLTIQEITADTSEKYVPAPTSNAIVADHIDMLQTFSNNVRYKAEKIKLRKREQEDDFTDPNQPVQNPTNNNPPQPRQRADDGDSSNFWLEEEPDESLSSRPGMKTGLYDKLKRRTTQQSEHPETEAFLTEFEKITNSQIHKNILQKDIRKIEKFDTDLHQSIKELRKEKDWILVPTDKTNKWRPMKVDKYITTMEKLLKDDCNEIDNKRLSDTYEEAKSLLEKFTSIMDENEYQYIETFIATRRIPMPRLLIKDHKALEDGEYPSRLLIPATNFTQCFAKLSYKCIKHLFECRGVEIMQRTIIQSSHLKIELDKLNLRGDNCSIASLNIVKMYPSIQNKLIRKAIDYYSKDLPRADKELIKAALEMQEFSMGNTLLMFRDKYYEYGVADNVAEKTLTIGGYDSAWLADLVGSYIFELAEDRFQLLKYLGLYRKFVSGLLTFSLK